MIFIIMALALILVSKNIGNVSVKDTNTSELFSWILCVPESFHRSPSSISIFREFSFPWNPVSSWLIHCFCVRCQLGNQPYSMLASSEACGCSSWMKAFFRYHQFSTDRERMGISAEEAEVFVPHKDKYPRSWTVFFWELSSDRISNTLILQKVIKLGCCSYNTKGSEALELSVQIIWPEDVFVREI